MSRIVQRTGVVAANKLWSPKLLSSVLLWWAPRSVLGSVVSWIDQVAVVDATQATTTKRPTASPTALLGYPGVDSDGGDSLVASGAGPVLAGKSSLTLVCSIVDASAAVALALEHTINVNTENGGFGIGFNAAAMQNIFASIRGTVGVTSRRTVVEPLDFPKALTVAFDFSASGATAPLPFIRFDGVAQTTFGIAGASAPGVVANAPLHFFGRGATPTSPWTCAFGDVVIREGIAVDADLDRIERFVGRRAGLVW